MNQYAPQIPLSPVAIESAWVFQGHPLTLEKFTIVVRSVEQWHGILQHPVELDTSGAPKLELNVLENICIQALNRIKAWYDGGQVSPFPDEAHTQMEAALTMATMRRVGVR